MALTQISTAGVKSDAITAGKIPANAVGSSEIADDAVGSAQIADDGVVQAAIADDAVVQAAIADDAVDEARLQISNAGSNGEYLSKQSGNTGGLTWAAVTGTTINNNADNRLITGSGTANTLEGEANLTYDGTDLTCGGKIEDSKGNVRSIPSNAQGSAHVATAADAGKAIYISTGGVTLNNSVFDAGDAVSIINNSGSDQTITQGSGVTMYNTADESTGNRTLAGRGMATVWFASASVAYISGAGLS